MTAEELLQLAGEPYRTELVDGMLRTMEPPGGEHGLIAGRVHGLLFMHVEPAGLGQVYAAETGFLLASDPDTVRAPDVAFIAAERAAAIGRPAGYIPGPPDLVVEVLSPSERRGQLAEKTRSWLRAGARAVLILDPPVRSATVHRPGAEPAVHTGDDRLDLDDVVPGWAPVVAQLFA